MNQLIFSTSDVPEHKRFSAYCDELAKCSCDLYLRIDDKLRFQCDLEFTQAGSIGIATHRITKIRAARTPKQLRDGDDALLVMLQLSGQAYQTQFGNDHNLSVGDAIICDSAYPGEYSLTTDSKLVTIKVPREKIALRFPKVPTLAGARLDCDPTARRLLSGYVTGMLKFDFSDSENVTRLHEDYILDLVELALGKNNERNSFRERSGIQTVRRSAVLHEIETSATDSAFDVATAAARLGITIRYVHHLLESTGRTFSEHVLDIRLAKSLALLRDARRATRKISDIAFEAGFRDLSYFNRVFRRKYGVTPSDIRHSPARPLEDRKRDS